MFIFRHIDTPLQFQTIYRVSPVSSGRYDITRQSLYSTKTVVAEGDSAMSFEMMLTHLPGPKGHNDVEDCLYSGDLLEITHSDKTVTRVALSIPSRANDAAWWKDFEAFYRHLTKA